MNDKILVTGASGNVGREVVKELRRRNLPVAAAALNELDARSVPAVGAEIVLFDFSKQETYRTAFEGVNKLFLMRPPAIADVERYLFPAIDYAEAVGVQQIVFLSLLGVNRRVPHYKVEQRLKTGRTPYTLLRPGFYMQNLDTTYRDDIRLRNEIFLPAGRGKTSFIDVRDIAAVAAEALTNDVHLNQIYTLTGSEALDYYQVASILSQALKRPITYCKPAPAAYARRLREQDIPEDFIKVMGWLYWPIRWGLGGKITRDVQQLLGRPPITFRQYAADYTSNWL